MTVIIVLLTEKPIYANYSALTKKIETDPKAPTFKTGERVRITKYKNIFSKGYTKNWLNKIFPILLETNPWKFKIKVLSGEKITQNFYEKELLLRNL